MADITSPTAPILSEEEVQRRRNMKKMQETLSQASQSSSLGDAQLSLDRSIYESALKQPEPAPVYDPSKDEMRGTIEEAQNIEKKTADEIIASMESSRKAELERLNTRVEDTKGASMFSGVAEAASALVNLIGTTQGATSQEWNSPQSELRSRLDQAISQRDASIRDYTDTMASLKQKRGAMEAQHAKVLASYDKERRNQILAERRLEVQNAATEARNTYLKLRELSLMAKDGNDKAKLEYEARVAEQKYNNLVATGQRIAAQTRSANATAALKEAEYRDLYGSLPE